MAPLNTTSVYRFIVKATSDGQAVLNIMHFRWQVSPVPPPSTTPTLAAALTTLITQWSTVIGNVSNSYVAYEYDLKEIAARNVATMPAREVINYTSQVNGGGAGDTGGQAGKSLPCFTAASVQKITNLGGRSRQGSMRLGPLAETDQLSQDVLTNARAASIRAALLGLLNLALGAGLGNLQMVVYSRRLYLGTKTIPPSAFLTPVGATVDVQDIVCYLFLGSQVSRKVRRSRPG